MADGSAAVGLQYEGEPRAAAPAVAALYTPDAGLQLLATPSQDARRFDGYVASIAASLERDVIAAACPYGGGVACWSRAQTRYLGFVGAEEPYGVSRLADGTLAISQRDGRARTIETGLQSHFLKVASANPIRWDDHWVQHSRGDVRTL
jgi:hypothetical protein